MAAYAGAPIEICCDGCGKRLHEDAEVYCLQCRKLVLIDGVNAEHIAHTINEIRAGIDVMLDSRLIAPSEVRDLLRDYANRLGGLLSA